MKRVLVLNKIEELIVEQILNSVIEFEDMDMVSQDELLVALIKRDASKPDAVRELWCDVMDVMDPPSLLVLQSMFLKVMSDGTHSRDDRDPLDMMFLSFRFAFICRYEQEIKEIFDKYSELKFESPENVEVY